MQAEVATMSVELNADKKKANTYKGNLNLGKVKNSKKVVEDFDPYMRSVILPCFA